VPDLDALVAAVHAGDSPAARDAVRELAELDDDRARNALAGALAGAGPLTAMAIQALARHGGKALSFAIAATFDPDRKLGGVAVLGKLGDPSSLPQLRGLVTDPDAMMRMMAAVALFRCGERDPVLWSEWIEREGNNAVFAYLAAIAGALPELRRGALDNLDASAVYDGGPAELRAGCAWAVARHDPARGAELAALLLADPAAAPALASVVRRRGGSLTALIGDRPGDPAQDRTADSVGLPPPS
jgi:HEAT repeat protein